MCQLINTVEARCHCGHTSLSTYGMWFGWGCYRIQSSQRSWASRDHLATVWHPQAITPSAQVPFIIAFSSKNTDTWHIMWRHFKNCQTFYFTYLALLWLIQRSISHHTCAHIIRKKQFIKNKTFSEYK
jgi:hypothetical protein